MKELKLEFEILKPHSDCWDYLIETEPFGFLEEVKQLYKPSKKTVELGDIFMFQLNLRNILLEVIDKVENETITYIVRCGENGNEFKISINLKYLNPVRSKIIVISTPVKKKGNSNFLLKVLWQTRVKKLIKNEVYNYLLLKKNKEEESYSNLESVLTLKH
ncbi:hypothetical protein J0X14_04420 [Muricauda sp. CAU 1633]|uniref:hypothetical protein n=1 Tax=Allomuricauda sp. CAU 1633 TaxID=2816036 RepID=UPI001A8FDD22|nr:hypothetical protein [Muricauda sp. CAU 1633]MBO0321533.1 hypothetical protein [Muricauda sp. CAU 1633]